MQVPSKLCAKGGKVGVAILHDLIAYHWPGLFPLYSDGLAAKCSEFWCVRRLSDGELTALFARAHILLMGSPGDSMLAVLCFSEWMAGWTPGLIVLAWLIRYVPRYAPTEPSSR